MLWKSRSGRSLGYFDHYKRCQRAGETTASPSPPSCVSFRQAYRPDQHYTTHLSSPWVVLQPQNGERTRVSASSLGSGSSSDPPSLCWSWTILSRGSLEFEET